MAQAYGFEHYGVRASGNRAVFLLAPFRNSAFVPASDIFQRVRERRKIYAGRKGSRVQRRLERNAQPGISIETRLSRIGSASEGASVVSGRLSQRRIGHFQ